MPLSKTELYVRYEQLAERLQRHLRASGGHSNAKNMKRLTKEQFEALCETADSNPAVRDWLRCVERGYRTTRIGRDAA